MSGRFRRAGWRLAAALAVTGLASQALINAAPPAQAATHGSGLVAAAQTPSTPVVPVVSHYTKPSPETSSKAPAPTWPSGSAQVTLAGANGAQAAGKLPVTLTAVSPTGAGTGADAGSSGKAPDSPVVGPTPTKASVTAEPQSTSTALGVKGLVLRIGRTDGAAQAGQVRLSLSYAKFADAFGGNYGSRLTVVALPACALTTPKAAACRTETPVTFTNDNSAQTLAATVTLPASPATAPSALVLAVTPDTDSDSSGSGGGNYAATSLQAAGSWTNGGSADTFTWNYPIPVPGVPGGLQPSLSLAYDSQSLDGLTSNTNDQAGVVGDGWTLGDSYIERSYASCHQNPTGPTQTYDNCWTANNQLTLDFDGQTTTLIKDDTTGAYEAQDDSGERIQYETGASNGAQNGEYWVLTNPAGTQYYFGLNQLPGYASGDAATNSVDTEPVYSTVSTQPCYNATFASSHCEQAYRWNLDYVVDTHNDAASYWYTTSTGYYAMDDGSTAPAASAYTRDSVLSKIEYGQRPTTLYTATPAGEVSLTMNGRCSSAPTGCAVSTLPGSPTNFPDVPYDQNCASGAACTTQTPTFWSEYEVTGIQTEALVGTTLTPVDSWALQYALPPVPLHDTSTPSLWLSSVTHTGLDTSAEPSGGTSLSDEPVVFEGTEMQNRVNLTNGYPWISRQRLTQITTETGEVITVDYSAPACSSATPSNDAQNTMLCYPVYWYPTNTNTPTKDYFNKYVVNSVTEADPTGGSGNDSIVTSYTPVGNPAWHYDDDPLIPANQDTWDQFRGYAGMIVSTGTAPDPATKTEYTYFQGMNGDYLSPTSTRTATVTDAAGRDPAVTDADQYMGMTYETQVFNSTSLVTDTIDTPWTSSATATHTLTGGIPSQQAFLTGQAEEQVYTPLASGTTRETETQYTHDSYGRVTQVNDLGDVTVPAQNLCTTTSYADNTTAWILDAVDESKTVSVNCSTTPVYPNDAVSDTLTFYDGSTTLGAAPSAADVTETERALSYTGSTPTYAVMTQDTVDEYGRHLTDTDADNRVTKTAYTPATGAAPTSVQVTDPMNLITTTTYDPLRDVATQITTPALYTTVEQYDALGRATAVFEPGFNTSGPANLKYTYAISNSVPSVVDTYTLNDDTADDYRVSETIYDSMLRPREVQVSTPDGNRDITDTYYNSDGWVSEATNPYYNGAAVSTGFVQQQPGDVGTVSGYVYDGAGRKTAATSYYNGSLKWQTAYTYGGNFVTTVPPSGGTNQTSVTDARGNQTDLIQYLSGQPTNYLTDPAGDYTDTKYTYTPVGQQATETDPAGNSWSWSYDLLGDQLTAKDPDTGTTAGTYDNAGQLLTSTDARGKQTSYVYDKDARALAEYDTTSTSSETTANEIASNVYDTVKKGFPTSQTSYSNGDVFTTSVPAYNTMGEPENAKYTLTGTDAGLIPTTGYTITYGYTSTGALSGQNNPAIDGLPTENLTIGHDSYDEPTGLASASWTYASAVGYTEYGQVHQYTMPTAGGGTVQATETYDPQTFALDEVLTTDTTSSGPVDDLTYTYGNSQLPTSPGYVSKGSGLLTRIGDAQNSGATLDTQCFTYDYAQHLAQAWTATDQCAATPSPGNSATVGGTDAPYWQSWTYDAAGDRLTETNHDTTGTVSNDTATTYHYPAAGSSTDQPHTLTSTTATGPNAAQQTATYHYDPAGNETSATGGPLGTQTYTWNDQDQLQSTATTGGTANYVYDAAGNQIISRAPGSTTLTIGDLQLTSTSGTLSAVRYYSIGGVTIAERTSGGVVNILIPDRQGTDQLAISTSAAQTVTRRQYLPFGATRGTAVTWVGGLTGYVGGQSDPSTGLVTLGARQYDSATGRFLSRDPLFEAYDPTQTGGYDYAGNDPVTASDPTGLDLEYIPDGGGGDGNDSGGTAASEGGDAGSGEGGGGSGGGGRGGGDGGGHSGGGDVSAGDGSGPSVDFDMQSLGEEYQDELNGAEAEAAADPAEWDESVDDGDGSANAAENNRQVADERNHEQAQQDEETQGTEDTSSTKNPRFTTDSSGRTSDNDTSPVTLNKTIGDGYADLVADDLSNVQREVSYTMSDGSIRRIDIQTDDLDTKSATEVKVGRVSNTRSIRQEVRNDTELTSGDNPSINSYNWEFIRSPLTGAVGPTGTVAWNLLNAGIGITIHY